MNSAEFDKFADQYRAMLDANVAITGESSEYFAEYKMRDFRALLGEAANGRFLDFGAGIGNAVPHFGKHFPEAKLTCVDVSAKSLEIGSNRFGHLAEFVWFDGTVLPFADGMFEAAYAACVFHHIPQAEHVSLLAEIRRVVRPGGHVMIYEHNPLNPLTRHAVDRCAFDENAVLIPARTLERRMTAAGYANPDIRFRLFFPKFLSLLRPLENHLGWCPLGAQYLVWAEA